MACSLKRKLRLEKQLAELQAQFPQLSRRRCLEILAEREGVKLTTLKRYLRRAWDEERQASMASMPFSFEELKRAQQLNRRAEIKRERVRVKLELEKLILVPWGDLHLDNIATRLDRIETEFKTVQRLKEAYVVFLGDATDNPVLYFDSFDTYLTPEASRSIIYDVFDQLGEKLLALLRGCHERHGEERADFDYIKQYAQMRNKPFLAEKGIVEIQLKKTKYTFGFAHKLLGYSVYNPFHPAIRAIREEFGQAIDGIITAHTHQSACAIMHEQGKQRAFLAIGTRKVADRYARKRGFRSFEAQLALPVLELNGLEKGFSIHSDLLYLCRNS